MMFSQIKGHSKNIELLKQLYRNNCIFHSYLFTGIEGIGKKLIAVLFAKKILCLKDGFDNCNCESCRMFEKNIHPDFKLIDLFFQANLFDEDIEEQNNLKISTIREVIRYLNLAPSISNKKVVIIDDAHKMVVEAQNALLKTIEEPTQTSVIILISPSKNLLLPTVVSRCHNINFSGLLDGEVEEILLNIGTDKDTAKEVSSSSNGSIGFALKQIEIIKKIKQHLNFGLLAPFIITNDLLASGNQKENISMLIEIINNRIYRLITKENDEEIIRKGLMLIKKNLKYKNYIKHNVNQRFISTMVLYNYFLFRKDIKGEKT